MDIVKFKDKLNKLIELNPEGNYKFINKALSESEVLKFEKTYNIKLPPDYRTFLTHIFNGGVGPEPIMPIDFWDSRHYSFYSSLGNKLSEPFLLTSEWEEDYDNDELDVDVDYECNSIINGTIRLCHIGCGNFLFLVVNGKEYGNIWIDDRASTGSIVPLSNKSNERINFYTWYNDWLDNRIIYYRYRKPRSKSKIIKEPKKSFIEKLKHRILAITTSANRT